MNLAALLARLATEPADRLLDECRNADPALLSKHPELYLAFCETLIAQGHPSRALELAREGGKHLRGNSNLLYRLAQAANRGGNPRYAATLLQPLLAKVLDDKALPTDVTVKLRVDILALQGSILKQRSRQEPGLVREAALWYERAAALPGAQDLHDAGTFPLINAATLWRILGEERKSHALATETIGRLKPIPPERIASDVWLMATLGEAHMLLGLHAEAVAWYERAVRRAGSDFGTIGAIRKNYQRLADIGLAAEPAFLDAALGSTVVFSGHLVDSPDRRAAGQPVRFPDSEPLLIAVKAAIAAKLDAMNARVGFCSLASGGDILFAEAMLARQAELHVVLPFAKNDFQRLSVGFGQTSSKWRAWQHRFDAILLQVPHANLHFITVEPYLGSDGLWDLSNCVIQGLTLLRARERVCEPHALLLLDRSLPGQPGGTAAFGESWAAAGLPCGEIDLQALREAHWDNVADAPDQPAAALPTSDLSRPIKSILFADVAGFSGIDEVKLPAFIAAYGECLRRLFASPTGRNATFANTWGDGLYVVFDDVVAAAEFAADVLVPSVMDLGWAQFGLGDGVPLRVGLHTGPVFEQPDLFQGRSGYWGQHVNRAARIEPATLRGCAYASETFAALLTVAAGARFLVEAVGLHAVAKDYDRCRLYRVERR